jgi:hypothetical protein
MEISRRDAALAAAALFLLATAIVRLATPSRPALRSLSIEGLDIPDEPMGTGATLTRETKWKASTDVYLMGWQYWNGGALGGGELTVFRQPGELRLFTAKRDDNSANPFFFQNGAAFRIQRGEEIVLRYWISNTGPPGTTRGARLLLYFVPVEGN